MKAQSTSIRRELVLPGHAKSLAAIRWIVTSLTRQSGFSDDDVIRIRLAVDEACSNIFEHGYKDMTPPPAIQIELITNGTLFSIELMDEGPEFNMIEFTPPDFPDHWRDGHERGAGLYLIHRCMDDIHYERRNGYNCLKLIKHISDEIPASDEQAS